MVHAINHESGHALAPLKVFTLAEANEMLPLVRRIAADLIRLHRSLEAQRVQREGLDEIHRTSARPEFVEEVHEIRRSLADDELEMQRCLRELTELGLQPHLPLNGNIDFPAEKNRRPMRLCWHLEDASVAHWHEIGQEAANRRRIQHP